MTDIYSRPECIVTVPEMNLKVQAHWFDEDTLFFLPRFTSLSDIEMVAQTLDRHGYDPYPLYAMPSGDFAADTPYDEPVEYYDCICSVRGEKAQQIYDAGADSKESTTLIYDSVPNDVNIT